MRKFVAACILGASLLPAQVFAQASAPFAPPLGAGAFGPGMMPSAPQAVMRQAPRVRPTSALAQPVLPPAPGGPHFRLRTGTMELEVSCGASSSVKDCAEAAAGLMDRVGAMSAAPSDAASAE